MSITQRLAGTAFVLALSALAQDTIPVGTNIPVRTTDSVDARNGNDGRIFPGIVDQDVLDTNGNVAIPRGANAEMIVRTTSGREMALDLESITVNGRRYVVTSEDAIASSHQRQGIGKNKRTGEFVGGGALLGTIIGAVAGGGRGALIGAVAGGAAGAGGQILTRGRNVNVPSESLLTFRLDRPLFLGRGAYAQDPGYDRNGNHYHRYQYNNDNRYNQNRQYDQERQYNERP